MLSLHTFSTPLLCILNLSAWNYKGHLHSEKTCFTSTESDLKRSIYNHKHLIQNFLKRKLEKKCNHLLPFESFYKTIIQHRLFTFTVHYRGKWYHGVWSCLTQPAGFGSLSLFACCWKKRDLDLLRTAASKEAWAHQALATSWHVTSWQYRQKTLCSMNDLRPLSQPKNQLFAHHLHKNYQLKLCFA